jgi:hypothetical protein
MTYDTINAIRSDLLKSASPKAQRVITENPIWFDYLYYVATEVPDETNEEVINRFWSHQHPVDVMPHKPSWFIPHEVLIELVDIARKNQKLKHKKR